MKLPAFYSVLVFVGGGPVVVVSLVLVGLVVVVVALVLVDKTKVKGVVNVLTSHLLSTGDC